jgi:hypothetical protein
MSHSTDHESAVSIARSALTGQLGILEAVRAPCPYAHSLPELFAEDANTFIGIESETDNLPMGRWRALWNPDLLRDKDAEIARCEQLWRDEVLAACERIILRGGAVQ